MNSTTKAARISRILGDRLIDCVSSVGYGKCRIRTTTYSFSPATMGMQPKGIPHDVYEFCGVQICPNEKQRMNIDLVKCIEAFDKCDSAEWSNWMKTTHGIRKTPHLRLMGTFRGLIFMVDLHTKPVEFEEFS